MKRLRQFRECIQRCWRGGIDAIKQMAVIQRFGQIYRFCDKNPFPVQCTLILLYRLSLDFIYVTELSPAYAYSGFTTALNPYYYVFSVLVLVVLIPFIAGLMQQESRPSSVLVTLLNYLYFIPLTSYVGCKGADFTFFLCGIVYWGALLIWQYRIPTLQLRPLPLRNSKVLFVWLTVISACLVLFISGKYTGFRFTLDFINVYGIRREAETYAIPALFRYLLSFMTVMLSILLLYWGKEKRFLVAGGLIIVYLFYYSIAAHKSAFLFLLLVLGCYLLYRKWMWRWAAGFLSIGVGACWFTARAGFIIPMSMLVQRLMYVPVSLGETYLQFFHNNPLNLFRNGLMGKLSFDSIYSTDIPSVIGEFVGSPAMNANNGLIGDMVANLPIPLGLLLMPLILVLCFRLLDLVTYRLPAKITVSFCVFFAITFMNASWSTALLSHGYLLACLLLYLFPRKEENQIHAVS